MLYSFIMEMSDTSETSLCTAATNVASSGQQNTKVLYQGAEARILAGEFAGRMCLVKERFAKQYRHPELDLKLRRSRLKAECKALIRCMELGICVPCIYFVDQSTCSIWMERLNGPTVRQFFSEHPLTSAKPAGMQTITEMQAHALNVFDITVEHVAELIGYGVGRMHRNGVVHGDLTTSNMIITKLSDLPDAVDVVRLAIIDFGLASFDKSAESCGVDLYVLERAIVSAHGESACIWNTILDGYRKSFTETTDGSENLVTKSKCKPGKKNPSDAGIRELDDILSRFEDVRMRGRKRLMIG